MKQTEILERVASYVDDGDLQVFLDRTYPLTRAGEAQQALEAGEITGRVALDIPQ
ncbi:MAG: zinc-binding dehydrogenase [Mycobacterium sp.]